MTVTQTSRTGRTGTPSAAEHDGDLFSVDTPVVSVSVHRPHMPSMPRLMGGTRRRGQEMNRAMETARTFLPPPERIVYYGGLGLLAAIGLMEWPVAAAIGAGTLIAQRACAAAGKGAEGRTAEAARPSTTTGARTTTTRTPRTTTRASGTTSRAGTRTGTRTAASRTSGTTSGRSTGTTSRSRATGGTSSRGATGTAASRGAAATQKSDTSPERRPSA
ncbi:hypothetical protein DQ384_11440 [Sphaerisporangium album]|uniref:Uncharacterized protein n=1 Tax=Sphaerisporangium album TaxID=509200 RepID=A0A367FM32_9ACTN|nr:hypothetical protein [Sphaerisporangium album]RCG31321.1 hypothetical protein DQ384_11440 [Sphaerisporangium album]